jgi:hypothetical protein
LSPSTSRWRADLLLYFRATFFQPFDSCMHSCGLIIPPSVCCW